MLLTLSSWMADIIPNFSMNEAIRKGVDTSKVKLHAFGSWDSSTRPAFLNQYKESAKYV